MEIQEAISKVQDAVTVKRVYREPYERDGVVIIPAAAVRVSCRPLTISSW